MKKIEDTETVDVKLKPCPFCGGEAVISRNDLGKNNYPGSFFRYPDVVFHSAGCPTCGISFSSENEQEAVSKWNGRGGAK
jgi:Lar family restriction alleviation protein